MKRLSVTVSDAYYDCLTKRAVVEGESPDPMSGKYQKTLRHAMRYYLIKNGFTRAQLDKADAKYHKSYSDMAQGRPAGGNATTQ